MRIVRYLINASLVLILSFSGLRANENQSVVTHLLDEVSLDLVEHAHQSSDHSALGFGVTGNNISPQKIFQADRDPTEVDISSQVSGFACAVQITNSAASGVYDELAGALEAASTSNCHQVVMQVYTGPL